MSTRIDLTGADDRFAINGDYFNRADGRFFGEACLAMGLSGFWSPEPTSAALGELMPPGGPQLDDIPRDAHGVVFAALLWASATAHSPAGATASCRS